MRFIPRVILFFFILSLFPQPVFAGVSYKADAGTQCTQGIQLFSAGKILEALPLLEKGVNDRKSTRFDSPDSLGLCAFTLAVAYQLLEMPDKALEPDLVALDAFRESGNREFQAHILNHLGQLYLHLGQLTEALSYFEKALVIRRELKDSAGEGITLNGMGSVYYSQGRFDDALLVLNQALKISIQENDQEAEGNARHNIGFVLEATGQYTEALNSYDHALRIARDLGDRSGEGAALFGIGIVFWRQGNYTAALGKCQEALFISKEIMNRTHEGAVLGCIGTVLHDMGQYSQALEYHQKSLAIAQEVGDPIEESVTLSSIGLVYDSMGQYSKAMEYLTQALEIQRNLGIRANEAITLNNFGYVYMHQGIYDKALEYYQQALVILRETDSRTTEGVTLNNISNIYFYRGQYTDALDISRQALTIAEEVGDLAGEGDDLSTLGAIYSRTQQYDEAIDYLLKALELQRAIGKQKEESLTLLNLGSLYYDQKNYNESLVYLQQALLISQKIGNRAVEGSILNGLGTIAWAQGNYSEALKDYQGALEIRREVGDKAGEGITLNNMGGVYDDQGQFSEALEYYENAIAVFETLRASAGNDAARTSFVAQHSDLYDRAIELYVRQGLYQKALLVSERGRARVFLDSLATGRVELSDSESAALYTQEQAAFAFRQNAQDALNFARARDPIDPSLIEELEEQLDQAEKDHQSALDAIIKRDDMLSQLIPAKNMVLDSKQTQALLDSHTTLLSFWVMDKHTLAFIITQNSLDVVEIDISRENLHDQIEAFRSFTNTNSAHPDSAKVLYDSIIKPLKPYLKNPDLIIIAHSSLHYLPFAALTDGSQYLLDQYSISYLPSISAWPYIKKNSSGNDSTPLILGNPLIEYTELAPLPFAEKEARAIANLYGSKPLLGNQATETAVNTQVSQTGVLHFAVHGSYNIANPLYSALFLAADDQQDGRLETHEIYGLNLNLADLVVLSACQTQLGQLSTGDEVVGLTRAFFFAGTPTVISSLWEVDDRATEMLMESFYSHLRNGLSKQEAFRKAQMEVRVEYPNPYYWSGFVLNGDRGNPQGEQQLEDTVPQKESQALSFLDCLKGFGTLSFLCIGGFFLLGMFGALLDGISSIFDKLANRHKS